MRSRTLMMFAGALLLVGCGGGADEESSPPAVPAAAPPRSPITACVDGDNGACQTACSASSVDACTIVGLRYGVGRGLPQNDEWARKFFQRACDLGSQRACAWASAESLQDQRAELIAACSMGGTDVCHSDPSQNGSSGVYLHMSGDPIGLQRKNEVSGVWESVCSSPCDRAVPPTGDYRLMAVRRTKSRPFTLDGGEGGRVTMDVNAGTTGGLGAGFVLTYIGAGITGLGALVVIAGAADRDKNEGGQAAGAGAVILGVGAALLIPGILLLTGNAHTKQTQSVARSRE